MRGAGSAVNGYLNGESTDPTAWSFARHFDRIDCRYLHVGTAGMGQDCSLELDTHRLRKRRSNRPPRQLVCRQPIQAYLRHTRRLVAVKMMASLLHHANFHPRSGCLAEFLHHLGAGLSFLVMELCSHVMKRTIRTRQATAETKSPKLIANKKYGDSPPSPRRRD